MGRIFSSLFGAFHRKPFDSERSTLIRSAVTTLHRVYIPIPHTGFKDTSTHTLTHTHTHTQTLNVLFFIYSKNVEAQNRQKLKTN